MVSYKIEFAKYKLRPYERQLAVQEFARQFPVVKSFELTDAGIEFITDSLLEESLLQRLTFFSQYSFQNGVSSKSNALTHQCIVESYRNVETDLFGDIIPATTREIRYLSHSFHEYKGRFYPQLAKACMNYAGLKEGDTVLDPFCGSGTTLVESFLFGANAIGVDINPIAYMLAKAKVNSLRLRSKDLALIEETFRDMNEDADYSGIRLAEYQKKLDTEYLQHWFPLENLLKVLAIQNRIATLKGEIPQLFVKVILSNILRDYSFQDPSQLRIRRRVDTPPTNLINAFQRCLHN